ncbi:unnamed protein product [Miscanthus lutarioriparius]|uniref:Uncharacterized protein n=1 Tax=Miscanthus lutarioriparius TaxID=422564 RepID=A0A811RYA5_9POAL|nr:unnamed protein product [Miscanthus lutarioriparius]
MVTTTMIADVTKQTATFSTFMNNRFDEINENFVNLNARLSNIERARSKKDGVDDIHKVLDRWTTKFNELFDGCNDSPSITDPIQPENNTWLHTTEQASGHGDAVVTNIQTRLDKNDAINSLEAETKQVMITAGKSFLNNKMEEPLSSNTPEITIEVSNTLFAAPPAPQPPLLPCLPALGRHPASPGRPPTSTAGLLAASTAGAHTSTVAIGHLAVGAASAPPRPQQPARQAPPPTPPQESISSATTARPPQLQPIKAQLTTPTYDGSMDPLPWLSRMQLLSKLHHVPADQHVRRDTLDDLAPPRHTDTMNNYIDNFAVYVLHVSITSELHQINLLIVGLQDPLQVTVARHHPRELETAIALARAQEHLAPTNGNAARAIPKIGANSDHTAQREVDAPSGKMKRDLAQPPATTPTPHNTHAQALLPLVGYNTETTAHPNDITIAAGPNLGAQRARDAPTGRATRTSAPLPPTATPTLDIPPPPMLPPRVKNNAGIVPILDDTIDPAIITQLRLAALDEQEPQIISATIAVNAATPAWSLQQGVILYNGRYYILVTSPLLQELLEYVGMTTPQLLPNGFHTAASTPATQGTSQQRPFFEACGFGDDMMGSTTMLYTRKAHK